MLSASSKYSITCGLERRNIQCTCGVPSSTDLWLHIWTAETWVLSDGLSAVEVYISKLDQQERMLSRLNPTAGGIEGRGLRDSCTRSYAYGVLPSESSPKRKPSQLADFYTWVSGEVGESGDTSVSPRICDVLCRRHSSTSTGFRSIARAIVYVARCNIDASGSDRSFRLMELY